jgi:DNA replication protein DnaC
MRSSASTLALPTEEDALLEFRREKCEFICKCENERFGELDKQDGYNCEICRNKGYILKPKLNGKLYEETQVKCDCWKRRKTIGDLRRSGLEEMMLRYSFTEYRTEHPWQAGVLSKAREYLAENGNSWFFIGGMTGSGKSHICTAIASDLLLQKHQEVRYMMWRDESRKIKATINDTDCHIDEFKEVDVLYIDDLFKTGKSELGKKIMYPSQGDINVAFEILNSRYLANKPTIISTEFSIVELFDVDDALASRIKERCRQFCINIPKDINKNYRLKGVL